MKELLLLEALDATDNGIVITDALEYDNPIVYINAGFTRMTGYKSEEVLGKNCRFLQGNDKRQKALDYLRQAMENQSNCTVVLRNRRKDGSKFYNELSVSPVFDDSKRVTHYIGVQKDVTDRILSEKRAYIYRKRLRRANRNLRVAATHDPLTGIFNRRFFNALLKRAWRIAGRTQIPLSILMIDIDFFKQYNDTYGHLAGDTCLKQVATTLQTSLRRASDIVARYGGEEFVVAVNELHSHELEEMAEFFTKKIAALRIPHKKSSVAPYITISCGVATTTPHTDADIRTLIAHADKALYTAKESGRNRVCVYHNLESEGAVAEKKDSRSDSEK